MKMRAYKATRWAACCLFLLTTMDNLFENPIFFSVNVVVAVIGAVLVLQYLRGLATTLNMILQHLQKDAR